MEPMEEAEAEEVATELEISPQYPRDLPTTRGRAVLRNSIRGSSFHK